MAPSHQREQQKQVTGFFVSTITCRWKHALSLVNMILRKEQKLILGMKFSWCISCARCNLWSTLMQTEPQWKWSSWWVSSSWYRYRPKPNRAQALQNAASSAAATASSLRPSWTCAVPVASLYAYTHIDASTLVNRYVFFPKWILVGLKRRKKKMIKSVWTM